MLRQWSLAAFQISIDVTFPQWDVTYAEMLSEVRYESYETSLKSVGYLLLQSRE